MSDERERMIEAMVESDILSPGVRAEARQQGSSQREPFMVFAHALVEAGFGDVSAERAEVERLTEAAETFESLWIEQRERAEQAEAMHGASSKSARDFWGRVEKLDDLAERMKTRLDEELARSDALQARIDAATSAVTKYAQGPDEDGDYFIEPEDGWRLLRDVRAALVSEEPAPEPPKLDMEPTRDRHHDFGGSVW